MTSVTEPPPSTVRNTSSPGKLLLAIAAGTTLAPLNSTMIAVALSNIQHAFDATVTSTTLLVTLYLVVMAVGMPIGGRLGDMHGRRRAYLTGLIWFGAASAGCAFAPNLPLLILFRTQQAVAGTLIYPNGSAIVREVIPGGRRGMAFGIIGLAGAVSAASGPPIGGVLVHAFGWSSIFWMNVPLVATALVLAWRTIPGHLTGGVEALPFDLPGIALFGASLATLITIPTLIKAHAMLLATGAVLLVIVLGGGFMRHERRVPTPVIDMRLFLRPKFAAACASILLRNLVMYSALIGVPLYLEQVQGRSIRTTGLILGAMSAFTAIWTPLGGRLADLRGRGLPAVLGMMALCIGTLLLAIGLGGSGIVLIIIALATMGLGLGLVTAPMQTAAVEAVSVARVGVAAGIYSTARSLGNVIGAGILAVVFVRQPQPGDTGRFVLLFSGLALVAAAGIVASRHVSRGEPAPS